MSKATYTISDIEFPSDDPPQIEISLDDNSKVEISTNNVNKNKASSEDLPKIDVSPYEKSDKTPSINEKK